MHSGFNWSLLYLASEWAIRLVMLIYVPQRRSAAASRTWLLLIFLLPWPGLVIYALFGRIYVSKRRLAQQLRASHQIRAAQVRLASKEFVHPKLSPDQTYITSIASRLGDFEAFGGNQTELLNDYQGAIDRLIADIEKATHHVHLLYYIFGYDETGCEVADALARAAARGVQCRVLMDAVGCKAALRHLAPRMRTQNVEVLAMLPVGYFRHSSARFDLRNHRKIAVIDGRIGYMGSQNIVDPNFVKDHPNEELVVRVTGPVVAQLQAVFIADHFFEAGEGLNRPEYFPEIPACGETVAQVVPSSPGYQHENGQELMISLLYAARQRVVITTPYFVPDEPFLQAMCAAALRGVELRLIVSEHANQLVTQLAQRSYYDELLAAGVHIHLYQPRFLHAKHLSIDDQLVLIGSSNIDIRSFALNSEVNILLYDAGVAACLRAIQEQYLSESRMLDSMEWKERPLIARTMQSVARLADSLL